MNTQVGKSIGIALLLAAGLIAALFAMGVFAPAGADAQATTASIRINPKSASPGQRIQISGIGYTAGQSVTITLKTAAAVTDGNTTGDVALGTATVISDGTFEHIVVLPDGALETHAVIRAADSATPAAKTADAPFNVNVVPEIRMISPTRGNSAVTAGTEVTVTIFGFPVTNTGNVDSVAITATDADGDTISGASTTATPAPGAVTEPTITIPAGLDAGEITIKAKKGDAEDTESFMVVEPSINLELGNSPLMMTDNSVARTITVKGTNFANGDLIISANSVDADDSLGEKIGANVTVDRTTDPAPTGDPFQDVNGTFTLPIATTAGKIRITAMASGTDPAGTYTATADFMLHPAPPAQVMGVVATPGEGSLAVTWTQVEAKTAADDMEVRPAPEGYLVEWKLASASEWADKDMAEVSGGSQVYHLITGLTPNMLYMVRVSATKEGTENGMASIVNKDAVAAPLPVTQMPTPTPPPDKPVTPDIELKPMNDDATVNAGSEVSVTIKGRSDETILGGDDIDVTLDGFGIPDVIDASDVIIRTTRSVHPAEISISDSKITLSLPTTIGESESQYDIVAGTDYEIRFKSSAGLTTPAYAGMKTLKVTKANPADDDGILSEEFTFVETASVKPTFVTRGSAATVTAKGLEDGTTTVHLGSKTGAQLGSGVAADGVVEIEIDTSGNRLGAGATTGTGSSDDAGTNDLIVLDASNNQVGKAVKFGIKPTVKLGSDTAERSGKLEISVSDWYYGTITMVTIGGVEVAETMGNNSLGSAMKDTYEVTVPSEVRIGEQEVKLTGDAKLDTKSATATVNVKALDLTIDPSAVVPAQKITITGSGFDKNAKVSMVSFDGTELPASELPDEDDRDVTSSGRIAITVNVPLGIGHGEKKVELMAGARTAEATITVAKPSITLDPAESVKGSVISVRGEGFASDERIEVLYDGQLEEVGKADGNGSFHIRMTIPSDAEIGSTNPVKVQVRNMRSINASADHKTPESMIEVTQEVHAGGLINITGTNFESFSILEDVTIGGQNAKPTPGPETDKNGHFKFQARVPRLSVGSHTVTIRDSKGNSATETFTVVDTPIVSAPAEVFGVLGDNLTVVWRYDNAEQSWASYSPGAPAELNDLTGVSRGDIVWIEVGAAATFQGGNLYAGWNLISLE